MHSCAQVRSPPLSPPGRPQADLTGANLTGADLTGANLAGAVLERAVLDAANMTNVEW
jgi:uncharacterized protein YjbI with pentapeptide repeats